MSETGQKSILIVDDDAVVLRTMKEGLSDTYRVYGANSGTNAMRILEKKEIDLILLDYEMPEMNGPQVLAEIRRNPSRASVPVFFLTGLQDFDPSEFDVNGCLLKTLSQEEILSRIASALSA